MTTQTKSRRFGGIVILAIAGLLLPQIARTQDSPPQTPPAKPASGRKPPAEGPIVQPGRKVGRVTVGMTRAALLDTLGNPHATYYPTLGSDSGVPTVLRGSYKVDEWLSDADAKPGFELTIVTRRDRVVQVRTNNYKFTTAQGLRADSSVDEIHDQYPTTLRVHSYAIQGGGMKVVYADSVSRGIAFEFITGDETNPENATTENSAGLIVHAPDTPVLPLMEEEKLAKKDSGPFYNRLRDRFKPVTPR